MATDGTFLVFSDPRRSLCVVSLGRLFCWKHGGHISSVISYNTKVCLSHRCPPLFFTSIPHFPLVGLSSSVSWQPCRHAVTPSELKDSAAPSMYLSWEEDEKKAREQEKPKSSVVKAKDWIDRGKWVVFSCSQLSFWCTHQNNLRPTAANPSG